MYETVCSKIQDKSCPVLIQYGMQHLIFRSRIIRDGLQVFPYLDIRSENIGCILMQGLNDEKLPFLCLLTDPDVKVLPVYQHC